MVGMKSWSWRRRLWFLLVASGVFIVVGAFSWLEFKPAPSCFDGEQNQTESGIDCGGSCARVCLSEVESIQELWTRILPLGNNFYSVATLLKNPNLEYGAKTLSYRLKLFDDKNLLVSTERGQVFINPQESLVIFHGRLNFGGRRPVRAIFAIDGPPVWQQLAISPPTVSIFSRGLILDSQYQLSALITNESLGDLNNLEVAVVLANQEQNALAVSTTFIEHLPAGQTKEVVFTWPKDSLTEPVAFIDFYPHFQWAFGR